MTRVIVAGGGLSGCGAAMAARKAGAEVTLIERTDMLVGVAIRAGETGGNGWYTAQHEMRFLGGGDLFDTLASVMLHENVPFPDAALHGYIYNAALIEPAVKRTLEKAGVKLMLEKRVVDVVKEDGRLKALKLDGGDIVEGDAFVDCTGTRGGIAVCNKYGKGCMMCLVRCFAYGDRVGVVDKAGGKVSNRLRGDGTPGMLSSAVAVFKDTLAPELKAKIEKNGLASVPMPKHLIDYNRLKIMGGQRSKEFVENVQIADIGTVGKCFGLVYIELDKLRQVPGFENVHLEDPRCGRWNHIGHIAIAEREPSLKVKGFSNLFCAGEKSGQTSVDGVIITGYLAGHNAARAAAGKEMLVLPRTIAVGDFMAFVEEKFKSGEIWRSVFRMARGDYWDRMQKTGLYTTDINAIKKRVDQSGLAGVLAKKV